MNWTTNTICFHPIENLNAPELDIYARLSEVQLLRYCEPAEGIFITESPKVIERALNAGYEPISFLMETDYHDPLGLELLARCSKTAATTVTDTAKPAAADTANSHPVPVYTANANVLSSLTGYQLTRGMLCAMRRKTLPTVEEICKGARRIAVLENVMNPTNVGAIFRSAAALRMDAVLLTPGCTDPLYRRAARVSMGTVFQVPWTFFDTKTQSWPEQGLPLLKNLGFRTAAMALCEDSVDVDDPALNAEEKLAIILGTEGDGLAAKTIADADYTVCIPMSHGVDSLNVAAASAVAFWQLGR